MIRHLLFIAALLVAVIVPAATATAQEPVPPDTLPVVDVDTAVNGGPRPRTVFIKAMVVPGWGHASIGAYRRGAVYFTLQAASWAMLGKSIHRLNDVRDRERGLVALGRDSLDALIAADTAIARELEDPEAYEQALLEYPGIQGARNLIVARQRHRQDWIVYVIVTTFASAIDAYVAAHLADFPREVTTAPTVDGGVALSIRVPIGPKR